MNTSKNGIYLATAALAKENFNAEKTIQQASDNGFDGVQLFINKSYYDPIYIDSLATEINKKDLGLIVHLPNEPTKKDIEVLEQFVEKVPNSLAIIHYLPLTELPKVQNIQIGWENSINKTQTEHIDEVWEKVRQDKTFFVFDYARLMKTDSQEIKEQITGFIEKMFSKLRPNLDILHLADKETWEGEFRDCMCVFGKGVVGQFKKEVKQFVDLGGKVVFEHEDLQMAIQSLKELK